MKAAVRRKAESEEMKITNLPFRKERTELVALSPSAGSGKLKKKAGDIEMAASGWKPGRRRTGQSLGRAENRHSC